MSEKGPVSPLERLGKGIIELAAGIGAIVLGLFLLRGPNSSKENKKER